MKNCDIAYILGPGSKHNNLELRYSLRSVERHINPDRVFVCGSDPGFLSEKVVFIPNEVQPKEHDSAWGIMQNLKKLCENEEIPESFTLLNDDYFLLKPWKSFPFFHRGELRDAMERIGSGVYYGHLLATVTTLEKKKLPTKHFDIHFPIVYNKKKLLDVINGTNWDVPLCPTMRSLYCNTLGIEGEQREDCKVNRPQDWEKYCSGRDMFSVGDASFDGKCQVFIRHLYPEPSKYEK